MMETDKNPGRQPDHAFRCRRCGNCCRGEGQVWLQPADLDTLADALNLTVEAFTRQYTRLDAGRRGLILTDQSNDDCIFLQTDNNCAVHAAKPAQCRAFPMHWRNPDSYQNCPALQPADSA